MRRFPPLVRDTIEAFRELSLVTFASAIAFRALVSLIPLTLLGLGLLAPLGLDGVWRDSIAPPIRERVTREVFRAIDSTVEQIFREGGAALVALASGLALWHLTMAMRVVTVALNRIHGEEESRPFARRIATSVGLAVATAVCLVASALVVLAGPRVDGTVGVLLATGRWLIAAALLGLAVALVVRYAPSEQPEPRWASAGSAVIIATWIVASLAFGWYVSSVADFTRAVGSLTAFLVLTAYVFTTSAIFLVGAQLDEVLRERRS